MKPHGRFPLPGVLLGTALAAGAADILGAIYDPATDQVLVEIAYRGSSPDHDFLVEWGPCRGEDAPYGAVGRLIDKQGSEAAREDFRTTETVSLASLQCRPAIVTLRLGRVALANVYVPAPGFRPGPPRC